MAEDDRPLGVSRLDSLCPTSAGTLSRMSYKKKYGARRETAERMWRIHDCISKQEYPNCVSMGDAFEVNPKTIKRDVEFMRDHWDLPIVYDNRKKGYFYSKPVRTLPGARPADETEVFALLVAAKAVQHYKGGGVHDRLMEMFRKQVVQLDAKKQEPMKELERSLSIRPFAPEEPDFEKMMAIASGLQSFRAIRFDYKKPREREAALRRLEPYHITCLDSRWYVIGRDQERNDLRMFLLARMTGVSVSEDRFIKPESFNPEEYLRGRFVAMNGNGDHEVLLEFDPWATEIFRGRQWHTSQELEELPNGSSKLRMRLSGLDEVSRWVLGWGSHVRVLGPRELIELVVVEAKRVKDLYN